MSTEDVVELTEEEKENIKTYQENIVRIKAALGSIRQRYLDSEKKALEGISKAESEYIAYVKALSQSKNIAIDSEKWAFDPEQSVFRRIT